MLVLLLLLLLLILLSCVVVGVVVVVVVIVGVVGVAVGVVVILFVSSFQMIALGIIGEYVWRGLEASRNRPSYLIEKKLGEFK